MCDSETVCVYLRGYQDANMAYTYREIGYDPDMAHFNVGNVLLLEKALHRALSPPGSRPTSIWADTFEIQRTVFHIHVPRIKSILMFRRRLYPQLASSIFLGCAAVSRGTGKLVGKRESGGRTSRTEFVRSCTAIKSSLAHQESAHKPVLAKKVRKVLHYASKIRMPSAQVHTAAS